MPRRVEEKGSRIYFVCCIHDWSALLWAYSKGGDSTKVVEYRNGFREGGILSGEC